MRNSFLQLPPTYSEDKFDTQGVLFLVVVVLICTTSCLGKSEQPVIWYERYDSTIGVNEIWMLNPMTQQQRRVIWGKSIGAPALSPSGKHVAYSDRAQRGDIVWVAQTDGINPRQVTQDAEWTFYFWIDDAALVVATSNYIPFHTDPLDYYLYDVLRQQSRPIDVDRNGPYGDGAGPWNKLSSNPERTARRIDSKRVEVVHWELRDASIKSITDYTISVAHFPDVASPCCFSWARDGTKAVFQARDNLQPNIYDLFLASDKGQSVTRLTDFGKNYTYATVQTHAISPDGNWVALIARLGPPDLRNEPYRYDLALANIENRSVEILGQQRFYCSLSCSVSLIWSPDSRYVATTWTPTGVITEQEVFVIDVQSKEIRQLTFDGGLKKVFDWR